MQKINAIIVDQDPNAVNALKSFAAENAVLFSIITVADNCKKLVGLINEHSPDALFIGLNTNTGFDSSILSKISVSKPKLFYMSDNKEDAYKGFLEKAIDFILKPLDPNRLIISVYSAIKQIQMEKAYQDRMLQNIETINKQERRPEHISVSSVDKIELIKIDNIIYCKADGKYTEFYTTNGKKLSSKNLGEYTSHFNGNFFRIHHSYLVNINHIDEIIKKNGVFCKLDNGELLPVARRRQEEFIKFVNK